MSSIKGLTTDDLITKLKDHKIDEDLLESLKGKTE